MGLIILNNLKMHKKWKLLWVRLSWFWDIRINKICVYHEIYTAFLYIYKYIQLF